MSSKANAGTKREKADEKGIEYNIERDEVNQLLRCDFISDERLEIAEGLARTMYERENKQSEFDSIKKQYNSELSALDEEVKAKQRLVHDGYEFRSIPCQVERNYNTNTYTLTRLDTQEIVEQRPLRPSELQRRIFSEKTKQDDAVAVPEEAVANA